MEMLYENRWIALGVVAVLATPELASAQGLIGGAQQGASQGAREGSKARGRWQCSRECRWWHSRRRYRRR